jgi:phosphopentomutase
VPRAIIGVFDSFGLGSSADADQYGDAGANTLGHIAEYCLHQRGVGLALPNLYQMGLGLAAQDSCGALPAGYVQPERVDGQYGYAVEQSAGKDTPSGHWEMAGVPVLNEWGYFPIQKPTFPQSLVDDLVETGGLPGILGNCHASGTEILAELGAQHLKTGKPICYTSADSVFQIAAHETEFGLERLYQLCEFAFDRVRPLNIARVIARPFTGDELSGFARTKNRRDYTCPPTSPTLLDALVETGGEVIAVGKIGDIFAGQGISQAIKADGNQALFDATIQALGDAPDRSLVFTNFVDFDMLYGHRRDCAGYARALESIDARLPELLKVMCSDDLLILTADHGCDPSWPGTDHTREHVPVLVWSPSMVSRSLGRRDSFADIGATIRQYFGLPSPEYGSSWMSGELLTTTKGRKIIA